MKFWSSALKFFGYAWVALGVILIGVGVIFDVIYWIVTAVILAPGIGALVWAQKLQDKHGRPKAETVRSN